MFKVKNKRVINQLASKSFKANKMRNIIAGIAIVLTTVLFTGLFTVASSMLSSMEESTMRQVGGSSHGGFKKLTVEQYNKIETHKSIKDISYSVVLGIAENQSLSKRPTEIRYTSGELNAKGSFSFPTTGTLPQNEYEVATDTIVLEQMGIKPQLGEKITFEYSLAGKKITDTFTLVGFWQGDKLMMASQIWLSPDYVKKQLEGYISTGENDYIGKINADVNFANSYNIESKLQKVIAESGLADAEIDIGVNWAYTGNSGSLEIGTIIGAVAIILMITFCGYLIISNVFYISVTKDIRFYGLLKTIGTTGVQIRHLIRRQSLIICLIGVPIGLVAGYFVGTVLTPIILSVFNTNVVKISINPFVFLVSALFAVITVMVSTARPSKIAAKVSPIEALRSTDTTNTTKKKTRKSTAVNTFTMAASNVLRNKKKIAMVTISLSLSLIILNSAYSLSNSFDMDKYLNGFIGSDFAVGDISNFNVHIDYANQETLTPQFLTDLKAKNGVQNISNIYFAEPQVPTDKRLESLPQKAQELLQLDKVWQEYIEESLKNPSQTQHIYGIDEHTMQKLKVFSGVVDIEKLKTGKYVIVAPYDSGGKVNYYEIGDKVNIASEQGVIKEYEVLAVATIPNNISTQHSHPVTLEYFMLSDVFLENIVQKTPMLTTVDVEDEHEPEMEKFIKNYCENVDENMQYTSKATLIEEYKNMQRTYKSVGLILSILVAFVGIMNFINTIATSISSRKREIAMLQSIGLTGKQTKSMLIFEGLIYTVTTAAFALTIGSVLGYIGINALGNSRFFTINFTVLPSLLCLPILACISALVPYIAEKLINKRSIVERLREAE